MKKYIILAFLCSPIFVQGQSKKIYDMTKWDIDSLLTVVSKQDLTITQKMKLYSELFLGMPYGLTCVGDGPYALYDTQPQLTFDTTNCMVYCEDVLALSISDNFENFFNNLQQIRYMDGIVGMKTRNHYTMGDWLPENDWLLYDVVPKVAGSKAKTLTRTISHERFFKKKSITDMRYVKEDRTITINYIPFDVLMDVKQNFNDGDILALIFRNLDNIFSGHMLMFFNTKDGPVIRESSLSKATALDTPYDDWVSSFQNSKKYIGITLIRVNDDLNTPGRIILPWEIHSLKESID